MSVVDLDAGKKVKDITVGAHLSHPEAIAVDPKADRAYVAIANSDQVAVLDTKRMVVSRTLSVGRPEGLGTAPVDLTVTPDGRRLLVAESGADEIAVFALPAPTSTRAHTARARAAGEAVLAARDHAVPRPASSRRVRMKLRQASEARRRRPARRRRLSARRPHPHRRSTRPTSR